MQKVSNNPSKEEIGHIAMLMLRNVSRWQSGSTLASDVSGPGSTPSQGALVADSFFHLIRFGKLSTRFGCEGGSECSGTASSLWYVTGWMIASHSQATWANLARYSPYDDE